MKKGANVIDLFCGAGGLSCGFKQAGFNILLGIDNDEIAIKTFKANHPESKTICEDISKITKEDIIQKIGKKRVDIIIGGPPCQGFSMAGNRDPNDSRNELVKHFLKIVGQVKPKFFIIENVPGLLSMKTKEGESVLGIIKRLAEKKGYIINEHLLNAKDFGVPQRRRRVVLIGAKIKNLDIRFKKKDVIPVKTILFDKEKVHERYFYSKRLIAGFKRREKINKKLKRGFGWQFLNPDEPSYTISARYYKDGAEALIKYSETEIRMLTPEECALIQSFPKNYIFEGSKMQIYKQIGNAVPPQLALTVAKSINKALSL